LLILILEGILDEEPIAGAQHQVKRRK